MEHTRKSLAEFAARVNKKKFCKLSSKRQHELLAALAGSALDTGDISFFYNRYNELHTWAELDRYAPPKRLSDSESLKEYIEFHNAFSPNPPGDGNEQPDLTWSPAFDVTIFLDQVRSPYNVGSALRIIDNFGLSGLVHSTPTLSLDHPRLKKSARGCEGWIPVTYEADPEYWLTTAKIPVIAIEKTDEAVAISDWQPPGRCILVAGNEEYGISQSILRCCTQYVQIPMFGFKKSMNVHQALSIVAHKIIDTSGRTP